MPSGIEWMMMCAPGKSSTLSEGCWGRGGKLAVHFLRVLGTIGLANAFFWWCMRKQRKIDFIFDTITNAKRLVHKRRHSAQLVKLDSMQIWSSLCFIVRQEFRRRFLTSTCEDESEVGMKFSCKRRRGTSRLYEIFRSFFFLRPCAANWGQLVNHRRTTNLRHYRSIVLIW